MKRPSATRPVHPRETAPVAGRDSDDSEFGHFSASHRRLGRLLTCLVWAPTGPPECKTTRRCLVHLTSGGTGLAQVLETQLVFWQ